MPRFSTNPTLQATTSRDEREMVNEDSLFRRFESNLRMTPATVSAVRNRYHAITRRINEDSWGTSSLSPPSRQPKNQARSLKPSAPTLES